VAIANAVADATALRDLSPPFTPARVWMLLKGEDPDAALAREGGARLPDATASAGAGERLNGSGRAVLAAPRAAVWRLLVDVEGLRSIIPGCEELRQTGPDRYEATVTIRIAGIGGRYRAEMRLADLQEPEQLRLVGRAEGRLGAGSGEARVRLTERAEGGTLLEYSYEAGISGRIAGFGHRMLDSAVRVLIGMFFAGLDARLGGAAKAGLLRRLWQRLALLFRMWRS
jgi:2-furoyl-CoA dehydrogenase large subunit